MDLACPDRTIEPFEVRQLHSVDPPAMRESVVNLTDWTESVRKYLDEPSLMEKGTTKNRDFVFPSLKTGSNLRIDPGRYDRDSGMVPGRVMDE